MLIGALGVLAVLYPPGVGPTPVEGIEITRPLWMFWCCTRRYWCRRPAAMILGALVLLVMVLLTLITAFTPVAAHIG